MISMVYLFSRILPGNTRAMLTGVVKMEITQVFISILILLILFGTTTALCGAVVTTTQSIVQPNSIAQLQATSIPFPALPTPSLATAAATGNPFAIAANYTGDYAFEIGPNLAVQIYAYSYSYAILSALWGQGGQAIGSAVADLNPINNAALGPFIVNISFPLGVDWGIAYGMLSTVFLDVLSPLVVLGIGIMLFQYLILVISQGTAFVIILPIALIMRSISFSGVNLRPAANSVLAIAIALYIAYPLMIVFNTYALTWIFTPCSNVNQLSPTLSCNPSAQYLEYTYDHTNLNNILSGSCSVGITSIPVAGTSIPVPSWCTIESLAGTIVNGFSSIAGYSGDQTVLGVQYILLEISEFMFTVIVMFAIDITVTLGFAMGLTRALNGGIEGAASFWSNV